MSRKKFEASDEQRALVASMASIFLTQDEMCTVLKVTKRCLNRHFKTELRNGLASFKAKIGKRLRELIDSEDDRTALRAVEFAARHILHWRDDAPMVNVAAINNKDATSNELKISFVQPNGKTLELLDEIDDAAFKSRPINDRNPPLQIAHGRPYEHDSKRIQDMLEEGRGAQSSPYARARDTGGAQDGRVLDHGPPPAKGGWMK